MRPVPALAVAVVVALAAAAAGAAIAIRSGGYAPARTATGRVTIEPGSTLAPGGVYTARYCGSYGNVATQRGYAYTVDLPAGRTLSLTDSLDRTPGPQDPARVGLVVDGPAGHYAWGPGRGGSVVRGAELLTADVDARLVGPGGDTLPLRARFACRPRVAPKRPPAAAAAGA